MSMLLAKGSPFLMLCYKFSSPFNKKTNKREEVQNLGYSRKSVYFKFILIADSCSFFLILHVPGAISPASP